MRKEYRDDGSSVVWCDAGDWRQEIPADAGQLVLELVEISAYEHLTRGCKQGGAPPGEVVDVADTPDSRRPS